MSRSITNEEYNFNINNIYDVFSEMGITQTNNAITLLACTLGSHFLNIHNNKKLSQGLPSIQKYANTVSLRTHSLLIRPSGFGKSMLLHCLELMMPPEMRIHNNSSLNLNINYDDNEGKITKYLTTVTEAGLVGTFSEGEVKPGLLMECNKGFLLIEEFTAILNMFKSTHSSTLQQVLLTSMDSGKVNKRLANGSLDYETQVSFVAGVQPIISVDAAAGIWRRFNIELYIPTLSDILRIKEKIFNGWNEQMDSIMVSKFIGISEYTKLLYDDLFPDFSSYVISDELSNFIKTLDIAPSIIDNYIKLAMGYNYYFGNIQNNILMVELDDHLKAVLMADSISRTLMMFHMPSLTVISVINEIIEEGGNDQGLSMLDIIKRMIYYQYDENETRKALASLINAGILSYNNSAKKCNILKINDENYFFEISNNINKLRKICITGSV